jgi:hypothetical protein
MVLNTKHGPKPVQRRNAPVPVRKPGIKQRKEKLTVYVSLWQKNPRTGHTGVVWAYLDGEKVVFDSVQALTEAREWAKGYGYEGIQVDHATFTDK